MFVSLTLIPSSVSHDIDGSRARERGGKNKLLFFV